MSVLSFLKSGRVEEIKAAPRVGNRKQWNPNTGIIAIRVWKDGSVFPSQAAVDKFDLEYRKAKITKEPIPLKDGEVLPEGTTQKTRNVYEFPDGTGNGLDIIDTDKCLNFKNLGGRVLFVAVTPKGESKLDLFDRTDYEDNGTPKASVLDQGTKTFGEKVLLPLLMEVYGIALSAKEDEGKEYVDLIISETVTEGKESVNVTEKFSVPILYAPKVITRGDDKGKQDYIRRENVKVYILAPEEIVNPSAKPVIAEKKEKISDSEVDALKRADAHPNGKAKATV